jgi:CHASE3 domain sensor protein
MRLTGTLRGIFTWLTLFSLLPIIVAVLGSGYVSYRYNRLLVETRSLVDHSLEVTTAINDLMVSLEDAETGQRGYLITGDEDYLEPYRRASDQLAVDFARLRNLVGDNSAQLESIQGIEALTTEKLAELEATISVRQAEGFDAARAIVVSDQGKDTMDRIRNEIAAMRQRETALLSANTESMRKTENRVVIVVGICVLISILGRVVSVVIPVAWRRSRLRKANAKA